MVTQTPARREEQGAEVREPDLERAEQLQEVCRVWLAGTGDRKQQYYNNTQSQSCVIHTNSFWPIGKRMVHPDLLLVVVKS